MKKAVSIPKRIIIRVDFDKPMVDGQGGQAGYGHRRVFDQAVKTICQRSGKRLRRVFDSKIMFDMLEQTSGSAYAGR